MTSDLLLRDVIEDDLPIFFEQQLDSDANYMAAFTARNPADRDAFNSHWNKILGDDATTNKTILFAGMHATRDTAAVKLLHWACGRLMRGVVRLLIR